MTEVTSGGRSQRSSGVAGGGAVLDVVISVGSPRPSVREMNAYADTGSGQRVLIVSASMGGGHDGAAYELQRRLRGRGHQVEVRDFLEALPLRLGYLIARIYALQLRVAPGSYQAIYRVTEGRFGLAVARWISSLACARLRSWTADQDLVVATYPLAGQALGRLRRQGSPTRLVVFLTDFSVHPLWVTPDADLHLVLHEVTERQVRHLRPTVPVQVGGPAVREVFAPSSRQSARTALRRQHGLSDTAAVALLVAGSWGVGDVAEAAREVADEGRFVPLVVCGRNTALRDRLIRDGTGIALGWVDDMATLMRGADVLVQNAGGLTSLEAFAAGLPVVSYNCLPGHGRSNAGAMAEAGVALHACEYGSLRDALDHLDEGAGRRLRHHGSALFDVEPAALLDRTLPRGPERPPIRAAAPAPRPRRRTLSVAAATLTALCMAAVTLTAAVTPEEMQDMTSAVRKMEHQVANVSPFTTHDAGQPVPRGTGRP